MNIIDMTALELSAAIRAKNVGVAEAVNAYLARIEMLEPRLNAFITVTREQALARAEKLQQLVGDDAHIVPRNPSLPTSAGRGRRPQAAGDVLFGVPVAVKDNISTKGIATTCASKMLDGYVPVFSATAVERLEAAGMVIIGKTNIDEFAMGGNSDTGVYGPVRNPWDISRSAGGSSGGSGAAVAAGEAPLALGSDTGGSIRRPCSFCGLTGIKPTYGAVSRYGLLAYASSMDQMGPIGRDVDDCAALLQIIAGPDGRDGTCVPDRPLDFSSPAPERLDGIRIGLYLGSADEDVRRRVLEAAKEFEAAGARVEEFALPLAEYVPQAYYAIACAEASSNLARYDGVEFGYRSKNAETLWDVYRMSRGEGFGYEVKKRILLGSLVLSSEYYENYYKKAVQVRAALKEAYDRLFERFDMILSPVSPTTAPSLVGRDDPGAPYKTINNGTSGTPSPTGGLADGFTADAYTVPVNMAGLPAISLPCGFDCGGVPVGFQLIGPAFSERGLVNAGRVYQTRTLHHKNKPEVEA